MKAEIENLLAQVLQISKKEGVQDCDLIYNDRSNLSLKAYNGELDEYKVSSSKVLGIRTIKNNKVGISYSESLDDDSLKTMVKRSVENSLYMEDSIEEICSSERILEDNSKTYIDDVTPIEKKIKLSIDLERRILEKSERVEGAPYNSFTENESQNYFANSTGAFCFSKGRYFSCFTSALLKKDNKKSMHYEASVARKFDDLDIDKVIDESFLHANRMLDAKTISNGKYSVIFSNEMLSELFGCFSSMFSGKSAMEKINPMASKLGQQISIPSLTIQDLPKYEDGFSFQSFDDEGNYKKDVVLIESGILKNFYHNSLTAKHFDQKNNACASRSAQTHLGVCGTTKVISTGESSHKEVLEGKYLYIIKAQGLHSGADFNSGDFSFAVSGYLCQDGEILHAINGITMSGNFYRCLNEIEAIGSVMGQNCEKNFFAPSIRFSGFSFAGA